MIGRNGPQTIIPKPSGLRSRVTPPCAPSERPLPGSATGSCRPLAVLRVAGFVA